MPCRCAERRTAIVSAARAVLRRDVKAARAEAEFVGRSALQDVMAAVRRKQHDR